MILPRQGLGRGLGGPLPLVDRDRLPKLLCDLKWGDVHVRPPGGFVAAQMQVLMVGATQRHGELVADLSTKRAGLRKFEMVRITGDAPTYQTRLGPHEEEMGFVSSANGL